MVTKNLMLKTVVADNVRNRMYALFPDSRYPNHTQKAEALAKKTKLGKNTVLRACDPMDETSIGLDKLADLAKGLDLLPYQLLIPYLDAKNPQIAHNPTEEEKRLYKRLQAVKK